jgi:hypothetical protein
MVGTDKMPLTGALDDTATYAIEDVPAGEVQVAVVSPDPAAVAKRAHTMAMIAKLQARGKAGSKNKLMDIPPHSAEAAADAARAKQKWIRLPPDVEFPDRSGITTTIKPGENSFNIELQ